MNPNHCIGYCPICGGGLCGVRLCSGGDPSDPTTSTPHGLVVCDECEAIWLEPNLSSEHQYANLSDARCPICQASLWGPSSHWADASEVETLGWTGQIDPNLDG